MSLSSFGARNFTVPHSSRNKSNDYLNKRLDADDWGLNLLSSKIVIGTLTAELSYSAMEQSYLTFKAGDQVQVLKIRQKSWWLGKIGDQVGLFPVTYMRKCWVLSKLKAECIKKFLI